LSAIDDLRSAQQQAFARLDELKPLVAEYEELRREVERLGLTDATARNNTAASDATNKPRTSRSNKPAKRPAGSSKRAATTAASASKPASAPAAKSTSKATRTPGGARPGSRAADIDRLVTQQPGITVADLGRTLGVNATSLYSPVRRLVSDGRLRKEGTALHPTT
jgi:hypothetical protein